MFWFLDDTSMAIAAIAIAGCGEKRDYIDIDGIKMYWPMCKTPNCANRMNKLADNGFCWTCQPGCPKCGNPELTTGPRAGCKKCGWGEPL